MILSIERSPIHAFHFSAIEREYCFYPIDYAIFVDEHNWEKPAIFAFLEKYGKVDHREMFNVFNMGIGMVLMVDPKDADQTVKMFNELGEKAYIIGNVTDKEGVVDIKLRQ